MILVSHDQEEVYRLADKIAVMNAGRIERFGLKDEVFSDPRTKSAARLTGAWHNSGTGRRFTMQYSRLSRFTAGTQLRLYVYSESKVGNISAASLSIVKISN